MNPKWIAKKLVEEKADIPKIYMACGEKDSLIGTNQDFKNYLEELGISVAFEVGHGSHEWDFWNRYINKVIKWLPLEKKCAGINSGNIGIE